MAEDGAQIRTYIRNVAVFDGISDSLTGPKDLLIEGSTFSSITDHDPTLPTDSQQTVIDGGGRTLMPGLIDAHAHTAFATVPAAVALNADPSYLAAHALSNARDTLLRGFTTVRDAGGPSFGIKLAIDEGLYPGPRIYPSGAFISQTSGHGDFRAPLDTPRGVAGYLSHPEILGAAVIADGVPEVLRGVREQLRGGASQIKMMAGGGVSSAYDSIDVTEYTEPELRAGVEAAANWGTYVMVHAYTSRAVRQALHAGVLSIEHAQLIDEETVSMIADRDAWWSLQPFLDDDDAIPQPTPEGRRKSLQVAAGTDRAYELAIKHGVNLAWGTDTLFSPALASRQGAQLAKMTRWFSPVETLRMATSDNARLLAMSRERSPYPGRIGVVEEGALADALIVDRNPLRDLAFLANPEESMKLIMKDGVVYKNHL